MKNSESNIESTQNHTIKKLKIEREFEGVFVILIYI